MRPSAGSIAMPGRECPCANVGSGTSSSATTLPATGAVIVDAAVAAKQIFQFTKHFAHNLFSD